MKKTLPLLICTVLLMNLGFLVHANESKTQDQLQMQFTATFIDANKQKMLGNQDDALDLFFDCLKIDPNSSASMFEIARLLFERKDLQGATTMLEKAVVANDKIDIYKVFLVSLYLEQSNYKPAISLLDKLIDKDPYNLEHHLNLASIYVAQKKYKSAKKVYNNAEVLFGDDELLLDEILKCELVFGKYDNVYAKLQSMINQYPDDYRYYNILAETYIHNKQYDKALSLYDTLLHIDPDTTNIHLAKLDLFIATNDQEAFLKELHYIFKDPSIKVDLKIETLLRLTSGKSNVLTKEQYDSYVLDLYHLHPDNTHVRIAYAEYLLKKDSIQEAKPHLYYILEHDKTNFLVFEQLLFIENGNQQWDSVYSISNQGLEYYPTNPLFYFYNGFSSYQLGKYSHSIDILLSGLHYVQDENLKVEFYIQIGEAYHKQESKKLGYQFFEKALNVKPDNALVLNNYSYYLSLDGDQLPKALEMSILSNKLSPDNPVFLDTHAWVLYKMEQYNEALEIIQKAYNLGGKENAEVVEHVGDIYYKLGDTEKAVTYWKEAFALDSSFLHIKQKIDNKSLNISE